MKQIIGINSYDNFVKYRHMKHSAFYLGFVPKEWSEKFGYTISPNRRYREKEQVLSIEEIQKICREKGNNELYIALNTPFLAKAAFYEVQKLAAELITLDIDGIISGTISLTKYLVDLGYKNIILSSLFSSYTAESISFFMEEFGANTKMVILPRELSIENIINLANKFPNIKFEVFIIGDNCIYNEGFCFSEHGYDDKLPESLCKFCNHSRRVYTNGIINYREFLLEDKEVKRKLVKKDFENTDSFENFHNLDFELIKEKIDKFSQYPNIFGFKVASRGRNLLPYIEKIEEYIDEIICKNS